MYFCMGDQHAIKSIVDTLRIPSLETRVCCITLYWKKIDLPRFQEIVLDMFFDLFNIKAPQWYKTFIDGRRLTSRSASHHSLLVIQGRVQCTENHELFRISSQTRNLRRRLLKR